MENKNKHLDGWISDEHFRSMRRNCEQYKKIKKDNESLQSMNVCLIEELQLYKSLFNNYKFSSSLILNLRIKTIQGEKVWVDKIRSSKEYIKSLDKDEEIIEWLKPVKCER